MINLFVAKYLLRFYQKILLLTCRFEYVGLENIRGRVIVCLWHRTTAASMICKVPFAVLLTSSKLRPLGEFLLKRNHKEFVVRQKSFFQTLSKLKEKAQRNHLAITVDGGSGPIYQCKPGVILIASKLGLPIAPHNAFVSNKITLRSTWDQHQIPLPFSKITYYVGEPLWIPKELTREQITEYQREVERRIHALI